MPELAVVLITQTIRCLKYVSQNIFSEFCWRIVTIFLVQDKSLIYSYNKENLLG